MAVAGLLAVAGVATLGFESAAQAGDGDKFEGTWINEVNIVTCPPAPRVVIAHIQSMTTYIHGGVTIEGGGPPAPPPGVSHSAGHGIWERTGHHTFRVFFRSHFFDSLGRLVRIAEVKTFPTLFNGDDPETPDVVEPYYLQGNGTSEVTNINPVDGTVINVVEGCNEATSRPMLFED
jgi:hypothetical protein